MGPFRFIKEAWRTLGRALTGEILHQIDTPIIGGVGIISLLLKRARRSGEIYVVLVGGAGTWYYPIDLDEFERFISASDEVRAAQSSAIIPAQEIRTLGEYTDMVLTGDVVNHIEIPILGGITTASFRLKRSKNDAREYIVLALISPGTRMYYPFELDEFHRFIASAKRIRDMAQSIDSQAFSNLTAQT